MRQIVHPERGALTLGIDQVPSGSSVAPYSGGAASSKPGRRPLAVLAIRVIGFGVYSHHP
jgi:hypothetical protein